MGLLTWLKVARRLSELEEVVTKLSNRWDEEELKYIELRARTKRMLDRTEKAAAAVTQGEAEIESGRLEQEGAVVPHNGAMHGGPLTERQKQIQQQILRRRGGA